MLSNTCDELFQVIHHDDGTDYLIGYEVAIWSLPNQSSEVQSPGKKIYVNADTNVKIYAEKLVLLGGATYELFRKNVEIIAREICVVNDGVATIDVSGTNGKNGDTTLPKPPRAKDGDCGTAGADGLKGEPATAAGKIFIYSYKPLPLNIKLVANGGNGGNGSAGQEGGNGGNGDKNKPFVLPDGTIFSNVLGKVDFGGNGGKGGDAGGGSSGGTIVVQSVESESSQVSAQAKAGINGAVGQGGSGGLPGETNGHPLMEDMFGTMGANGQNASGNPTDGSVEISGIVQSTLNKQLNPLQLNQLINRILFTYRTKFSESTSEEPDWLITFKTTWQWIQTVLGEFVEGPPVGNLWKYVYATFARVSFQLMHKLDFYRNRYNFIPITNLDISEIAFQLTQFKEVEDACTSAVNLLIDYKQQEENIKAKFEEVKSHIQDETAKIKQAEKDLVDLQSAIEAAQLLCEKQQETLQKAFDYLKSDIKTTIGCEFNQVLLALSTVLMFTQPELVPIIGAGLTMAATFHPQTLNAGPSGSVDKKYLVSSIVSIDASNLKDIKDKWEFVNKISKIDEKYVALLIADQQKFQALCTTYLQQFPSATTASIELNRFIEVTQDRNLLLKKWNEIFIDFQERQLEQLKLNDNKQMVLDHLVAFNNNQIQDVAYFFNTVYESCRTNVLFHLYAGARAFYAASLTPDYSHESLTKLDTLSELNYAACYAVYTSLTNQLETFKEDLGSNERVKETIHITLNKTNASHTLEKFIEVQHFSYIFRPIFRNQDPKTIGVLAELVGKANIRVRNVRVFLVGAIATDNTKLIPIVIRQSGKCSVVGTDNKQHDLEFKEEDISFEYSYEHAANPLTYKPKSKIFDKYETSLHFKTASDVIESIEVPLVGIYGQWIISVEKSSVDLSHVTEIRMEFDIVYQNFEKPLPTAPN